MGVWQQSRDFLGRSGDRRQVRAGVQDHERTRDLELLDRAVACGTGQLEGGWAESPEGRSRLQMKCAQILP